MSHVFQCLVNGTAWPALSCQFWYDVHRTCYATFLADEAAGDRRPRQVLGQRIQPDINHAAVALTAPEGVVCGAARSRSTRGLNEALSGATSICNNGDRQM